MTPDPSSTPRLDPLRPETGWTYCDARPQSRPDLPSDLNPRRLSLIVRTRSKWMNGTVLKYFLFGADGDSSGLAGPGPQLDAVREAFEHWKSLGIGLEFREVAAMAEAEVRVSFDQSDGSWSYVGTDLLGIAADEATMNFGWDLTTDWGRVTALHEIGHTLGFPHEHQNPNAGIEWDEPAVLAEFSGAPNHWNENQIRHNILNKLDPSSVEGSTWDPASVMEYPFEPGLILRPQQYRDDGVPPPTGLSERDQEWVLSWYPGLDGEEPPRLRPHESRPVSLEPGGQVNFLVEAEATGVYEIGTFGSADTLLVVFEEVDGELVFLVGDDDSGEDRNARVKAKLQAGRRYVVRVRLYYAWASGTFAVMLW